MKNLKGFIVYGLIIFLCIAALAGYLLTNINKNAANTPSTASTAAVAASSAPAAASSSTGNALSANMASTMLSDTAAANVAKGTAGSQDRNAELMRKASAEPDPNPIVGIGRGTDYAQVTEEAIKNAGGLEGIIKEGDTVLIKPNICTSAMSGDCIITDYRVVEKIADIARTLGAKRIIVADGTIAGNAFDFMFLSFNKYDQIKGVELFDFNACGKEDCYELKPERSLTGKALFIPKLYMDADVVIDIAKLKTHSVAVATLSLKNAFGVPPGKIYGIASKQGLHELGLDEAIIDLNRIRKPDFALIEGIVGGEGEGPLFCTPVESNIMIAGKDLVALDTVGLTFMGLNVNNVPHVKLAGEEKLGISDLKKIKVVGAELDKIKMRFVKAVSNR